MPKPKVKSKGKSREKELPFYKYNIDIQTYQVMLNLVWSNKLSVKELCSHICKEENVNITAQSNEMGDGAMTVMIPERRTIYIIADKDTDITMLHHECIHATMFLFYMIQTPHTDDTDEIFAYLSQSIFDKLYNTLLRDFKVNRKKFLAL